MRHKLVTISFAAAVLIASLGQAAAGVYSSDQVVAQQQHQFSQQQVLAFVDSAEVQQKLIQLGVSPDDAKQRIASMTTTELDALNTQLNDMPAGGIVGTIVTVLVVIAVLDLLGVTDVYPFIRPINS
ncbi:MAG: PA2779 family protein [Rheinheimera sp.]|jgi:hypothetical protein|nr:PA2779 family protein [Rheinheimera sp.]